MEPQTDYEATVHLAVFNYSESAQAADRALRAAGIDHTQRLLPPGRYQLADPRLRRYTRAATGAAIAGAVVGAIIGVGLALWFFGAAWHIATWFGVAGAGGGAVVGGLVGLEVRARYDADVARSIVVPDEPPATLITTYTTHASPGHAQARAILERAGAVAFLDVAIFQTRERMAADVESSSAGGQ